MSKKSREVTEKDYARLGKELERALARDNIMVARNWKRFIGISFVRGVFVGFGTVVGATVLVALAVWTLNAFGGLPLIGEWFETLQESLKQSNGTL